MEEFKESCGYYGLLGRDGGWGWNWSQVGALLRISKGLSWGIGPGVRHGAGVGVAPDWG